MKYLKNITFIFFSLLLFAACNQEEEMRNGGSPESLSFKLNIPTSVNVATRAGTSASDDERTIGNVFILIYENTELKKEAAPIFFYSDTKMEKKIGTWEQSFVRSLMNLEKDKTYMVYALSNMPQNESGEIINAPVNTMNQAALSSLIEELPTSRQQNGSDISFSAKQELIYTGNELSVSIDLVRTTTRLNVIITKADEISDWTIESVTLGNENTGADYFVEDIEIPSNTGDRKTAQTILWSDGVQDGKANYHYYPYENESSTVDASQLHLTMVLKDKSNVAHTYKTIVNAEGNSQLKRDYVYTMNITLKDTPIAPVTATCDVVQWKEAEYPTYIGGQVTFLNLPDMIYFGSFGEGALSITTDAKDVKITLNDDSRLHFVEGTEAKEKTFAVDSLNNCLVNLNMTDLTENLYEETIKVEAGHLTKTVKCIRKANLPVFSVVVEDQANENKEFTFDYGLSETGMKKDLVTLKIKRNASALYSLYAYAYKNGSLFVLTPKHIIDLPLTQPNMNDEININLSEAPLNLTVNYTGVIAYVEIKVALFDREFPFIYDTYIYKILPISEF